MCINYRLFLIFNQRQLRYSLQLTMPFDSENGLFDGECRLFFENVEILFFKFNSLFL
ncbi:hypothetical protein THIOM_004216 [Candidatus Thiomargarita nelsonii]|uniref:Uncharacterized protein n=1 Tax=Candidatus Thiomargarita nelsonii TaxID=1003181 RepID=A0A176RWG0_9GAMM|nr:hypothetical protein THIOM_004216 [Candidatus Thiomargarita nelsonii]